MPQRFEEWNLDSQRGFYRPGRRKGRWGHWASLDYNHSAEWRNALENSQWNR
jgi:hypothetical protein